jgi:CRP-like cAMP-binding protein
MLSLKEQIKLSTKIYPSQTVIPLESGKVYLIKQGIVYLWEISDEGDQILLDIFNEGIAFEINDNFKYFYELRVEKTTAILALCWEEILENNKLTKSILSSLREHSLRTQELHMIQRKKYVEDRVINFLCFLSRKFCKKVGNEILITIPVTHEEIACAVMSTRATVTRVLNQLNKENKINYVRRNGKRYIRLNTFYQNIYSDNNMVL